MLSQHRILTPDDIDLDYEYEETGTTFLDNAVGKALHLNSLVGKPVIADDSGLVVPALNGDPGVRSARYGDTASGTPLSDSDRYNLLLENMKHIEDRNASFICCMVLCMDSLRFFIVQERFDGEIALAASGEGGFGYDPVFYIAEERATVAEIPSERKHRLSHRGKALRRMQPLIESLT